MGAIGVVELDRPSEGLRDAFPQRGVWVRPFGKIVYLTPPLIIGSDDLLKLTDAVIEVVTLWSRRRR